MYSLGVRAFALYLVLFCLVVSWRSDFSEGGGGLEGEERGMGGGKL